MLSYIYYTGDVDTLPRLLIMNLTYSMIYELPYPFAGLIIGVILSLP